ncbi:uncharacterized protein ARMOST_15447 [Armillaria ostoyae]|uniref:Uncharacterized protein n=1 Tax=Armillaria ostoyae TaxID=47428 RepID=A0A284RTI8_ARMOS|nr:uncharacterized protein ARMOST_15447 [Armillaria ostoyae]
MVSSLAAFRRQESGNNAQDLLSLLIDWTQLRMFDPLKIQGRGGRGTDRILRDNVEATLDEIANVCSRQMPVISKNGDQLKGSYTFHRALSKVLASCFVLRVHADRRFPLAVLSHQPDQRPGNYWASVICQWRKIFVLELVCSRAGDLGLTKTAVYIPLAEAIRIFRRPSWDYGLQDPQLYP